MANLANASTDGASSLKPSLMKMKEPDQIRTTRIMQRNEMISLFSDMPIPVMAGTK
jgi:hypothetical protein